MSADPTPPPLAPARWSRAQAAFDQLAECAPDTHAAGLAALFPDPADADLRELVAGMLAADADARLTGEQAWRSELVRESLGMADWAAGTRIGPWQVEALVGRGGMGEVYRAVRADGTVAQTVAIKRLSGARGHPEFERRFLAERRVLARLNHPHIARFLDAGADPEGRPYAVMEYVDGRPLTQHAWSGPAGGKPLDVRARVALLLQVADAVAHAHAQLVVHRDLKPGNVLVDAKGEPRLLDFGIAKALAEFDDTGNPAAARPAETEVGQRLFSLGYAAPEQLRGGAVGVACDVYGLGGLLYELLTGRPPLQLDGLAYGEAERRVLEEWPKPPSANVDPARIAGGLAEWQRSLKGDLDNIVLHALEKDPARRYGSVAAFIEDLQRHLDRQPISLRRDHRWYRFGRFVRRQWLPLGLASGIVVALGIGGVLLWQQSQMLEKERDAALRALTRAESVTRLLTNAFEAADPSRNEGKTLLAKDVLAVAAAELEHSSNVDPLTRLVLGTTVAEVQLSIGEAESSLGLLRQLAAALPADLPPLERARVWIAMAKTQLRLSDLPGSRSSLGAAERAIDEAQPGLERQRMDLHRRVAYHSVLHAEDRSVEALKLWKLLLADANRWLPAGDGLLVELSITYASRLMADPVTQGEAFELAETIAGEMPDIDRSVQGRRLLQLLTRAARSRGDYPLASKYVERYLAATRMLFGDKHLAVVTAYDLYARVQADLGQFEQAESAFQAALEVLAGLPENAIRDLPMMVYNNHADFLRRRLNDLGRAEIQARAAVAIADRLYTPDNSNRAYILSTLAAILLDQQRHAEVLPVLQEIDRVMQVAEQQVGRELLLRAENRLSLAIVKHAAGAPAEATRLVLQAWQRLRSEPPEHKSRQQVQEFAKRLKLSLP